MDEWEWERLHEQQRRAHVFVLKLPRRRIYPNRIPISRESLTDVRTFGEVHSAAEFAAEFSLLLDAMVTIDFGRIGITAEQAVIAETTRFIKCYVERASDISCTFPPVWMYAIEQGADGYHAHIALHVPGIPATWADSSELTFDHRKTFRDWARGYAERQYGRPIPRALRVKADRRESLTNHWRNVSYLLKGYDPSAIAIATRNAPDRIAITLGDLIASGFSNPGPLKGKGRLKVCHSLGPKQRQIGAPTGLVMCALGRKIDTVDFDVDGKRGRPLRNMRAFPSLIEPRPFQSRWEAGVRDVRQLYPSNFYRFVTRQEPFPPRRPAHDLEETLACQLAAMAD